MFGPAISTFISDADVQQAHQQLLLGKPVRALGNANRGGTYSRNSPWQHSSRTPVST